MGDLVPLLDYEERFQQSLLRHSYETNWEPVFIPANLWRCGECKMLGRPGDEPDPCLGYLVGVDYACCGHGRISRAYLKCSPTNETARVFDRRQILDGRNAWLALLHWPRSRRKR